MKSVRIICMVIGMVLLLNINTASAMPPYTTYTYNYWGSPVPGPAVYLPYKVYDGNALGITSLKDPNDLFVDKEGAIYILDSGNNRIICLDRDWSLIREIEGFTHDGIKDSFSNPQGFFVTEEGEIYVADTENSRIVVLDLEGNYITEYGPPVSDVLPADFVYNPTSLAVDKAKRIYVIARTVNQGLIEMDSAGEFIGFMGAPKVTPDALQLFWRMISTKEQRSRMEQFVPTEYNNISIDDEGFLYVTTSAIDSGKLSNAIAFRDQAHSTPPIKRLNPTGDDVLRRRGYFPPVGDINWGYTGSLIGPSAIIDVAVGEYGTYSLLDSRRGRIFTYDLDGNLLYVFGGIGVQEGLFRTPVAIESIGDQIIVLDKVLSSVTVFERTEYGKCLTEAVKLHYLGRYDESTRMWEEVLNYNANSDLAYIGIGKAYLRQGEYKKAMQFFKLSYKRDEYSKAYKLLRKQTISGHFGYAVLGVIALYFVIKVLRILIRRLYRGGVHI
jgi:DNA-binding beta-propeller fold protein YncE